ncbi:MAG: cobalamin-binding domain-containing protein [Tissierellales bacterium]|nr:cobalamin-binding domain-containing protein [Tissierellales bacterium]
MRNILLVEPDYRSKFPPLGLLKLSTYHKRQGDSVTFVRGRDENLRSIHWHRIYVSSLFTWELQRTVKTIKYYQKSVSSHNDLFVGGIGATLLPEYIRDKVDCRIIEGQIEKHGILDPNSPPIAHMIPDYDILDNVDYTYEPGDAYFGRITKGCIRNCKFCAVPKLEPEFGLLSPITKQVKTIKREYGEKQDLVIMDNNVLAIDNIEDHIAKIADLGFERGSKRNNRLRNVDFNQGIDARLIGKNPRLAKVLSTIALKPVRLAFDFLSPDMERSYRKAIKLLSEEGFKVFTNYMLYNYKDIPEDFYRRLEISAELNEKLGVRVTTFPMRYIPITDIKRGYIAPQWKWRWLRGIQCVLQATRGLVSPNPVFIKAAFGNNFSEFLEILSMPDRYIVYREHYKNNGVSDWRKRFRRLSESSKNEFLELLAKLNKDRKRKETISQLKRYRPLLEHYYPGGDTPGWDFKI